MRYTIENEFIRLTVDSLGAEMVSVIDVSTGREMLWCADPAVWNRHAPILFPYAGKLTGGHFLAEDGKVYEGGQHRQSDGKRADIRADLRRGNLCVFPV